MIKAAHWPIQTKCPIRSQSISLVIPKLPLPFQIGAADLSIAVPAHAQLDPIAQGDHIAADLPDVLHIDHRAPPHPQKAVLKQGLRQLIQLAIVGTQPSGANSR